MSADWSKELQTKLAEFSLPEQTTPNEESPPADFDDAGSSPSSDSQNTLHDALSFAIQSGDYIAASRIHSRMLQNTRKRLFRDFKDLLRGKNDSEMRIAALKRDLLDALGLEIQRLLEDIAQRERDTLGNLQEEHKLKSGRIALILQAKSNPAKQQNLPELVDLKAAEAKYVEYRQFHLAEGTRRTYNKLLKEARDKEAIKAEAEKANQIRLLEKEAAESERAVKEKYDAMRQNIELFRSRREQEISTQIASKTSSDAKELHQKIKVLNERKARIIKSA